MHQKMETGKYHLGSARHAAEYEEVTQMVINIIKKDFEYAKDIALALKQMIHIDIESEKPRPTMSENEDLDIKKIENEHLRMEYQMDLSEFRLRSRAYKANTMKAYALIWINVQEQ